MSRDIKCAVIHFVNGFPGPDIHKDIKFINFRVFQDALRYRFCEPLAPKWKKFVYSMLTKTVKQCTNNLALDRIGFRKKYRYLSVYVSAKVLILSITNKYKRKPILF